MASNEVPTRRRQGSKHDKTGCLTCRHRRKKCQPNTFPVCGTCARLNLECVREPPRKLRLGASSQLQDEEAGGSTDIVPALSPRTILHSSMGASTLKRHAVNYYMAVLANHATVSEQHNSFLSAFLPMAMESKALTEALSSWSLSHMTFNDPSNEMQSMALQARSTALRELAVSLRAPDQDLAVQETNAAASLLMTISEVCQGDRSVWYSHLQGTRDIIVNTVDGSLRGPEALRQTTEGQWILRNFAYHDILASVTLQQSPMLKPSYLNGITDLIDTCLGVATSILQHIAEISWLEYGSSLSFEEQGSRLDTLEQILDDWQCPASAPPDLSAVAEAYRSAAQILLFRLRSKRSVDEQTWEARIDAAVVKLLDSIFPIPLESVAEAPLVFPVFIAGGEAKQDSQRNQIRRRLHASLEKRKFQNIVLALETLEQFWTLQAATQSSADSQPVTWKDALNTSGGGLILT